MNEVMTIRTSRSAPDTESTRLMIRNGDTELRITATREGFVVNKVSASGDNPDAMTIHPKAGNEIEIR